MQTHWGELRVSDAHVHFFSRRFLAGLGAPCGKSAEEIAGTLGWEAPPEDPVDLARRWTEELDGNGVSRAALMASAPGDEASVAAAIGAYPDRFFGYFMFNPVDENAIERVKAAYVAGLRVACLFPAMHRYSMHDERVQAVLQEAAATDMAVFVHCGVLTVGVRKKLGLPSPFDMRFSNPLDLQAPALRFPKLRFIVPHFGAGYLRETLMLADLCPNVYLDTSSSNSWMHYEGLDLKTVFRRVLNAVGAKRLLFGTDSSFFPRGWNRDVFDRQSRALLDLGISGADATSIFGENLENLL